MPRQPIELPHPPAPVTTATAVDRSMLQALTAIEGGNPGWSEGVQFTSRGCQPFETLAADCFEPSTYNEMLGVEDLVATANVTIDPITIRTIEGCDAEQLNPTMQARVRDWVRAANNSKLPCALGAEIERQLVATGVIVSGIDLSPATAFGYLAGGASAVDGEEVRIWAAASAVVPILTELGLIVRSAGGGGYIGPLGLPFLPLSCSDATSLDDFPSGLATLWSAPGIWADWVEEPDVYEESGAAITTLDDDSTTQYSAGNILGNQFMLTASRRAIAVVPTCNVFGATMCVHQIVECGS